MSYDEEPGTIRRKLTPEEEHEAFVEILFAMMDATDNCVDALTYGLAECERLRAQLTAAREALSHYADADQWIDNVDYMGDGESNGPDVARAALVATAG